MRIKNNQLHFTPQIPKQWQSYSFKINFRGQILKVNIRQSGATFEVSGQKSINIVVNGQLTKVEPNILLSI